MADRVEVLITGDASGLVRATDQASSAMQDFGRATSGLSRVADAFRSDFGRLTAAFGAAQLGVTAVMGAFESAGRAIQAMNAEVIDAERVASKLIAVFDGAEGAAGRLTAQAEALAGSTVFFDDDAIKSAAAAMRGFELTEQEISKLLPVAVNLATVFGTDLENAATKLALGLNGSTRGLREFEIVAKEGADRASIMAQILERGEKAAKGAADAQGGLRGATEGLKKAQGEFNQALGTLLAGPQSAFLQFLTDATNAATGLANKMGGVTESLIKTARVIDPLTGKIVEATGVGGKDLFGPGSLTAQFAKGAAAAVTAPRPAAAGARPSGRAATLPTVQGFGPGLELGAGVNVYKAINASVIAAENKAADIRAKAAQDAADAELAAVIEADKRAVDTANEMRRIRLEGADAEAQLLEDAAARSSEILQSGIRGIGDAIAGLISGRGDFRGLAGQIAGLLGGALGGPVGSALATAGTSIASAIFDRMTGVTTAQKQAADRMNEAADRMYESATRTNAAFEEAQRTFSERTGAVTEQQARVERAAAAGARNIVEGLGIGAGDPKLQESRRKELESALRAAAKLDQNALMDALKKGPQAAIEFLVKNGLMEQGLGGSLIVTGLSGQGEQFAKAVSTELFKILTPPGTSPNAAGPAAPASAEDIRNLGDTPRNPVYVFDVTPSKDEFTRAPRGMFFRPVGSGRGVDAGQSVSGVSANTSNRASRGRTDSSRRMA